MANKYEIVAPEHAFYYFQKDKGLEEQGLEWLGVDIRGYPLEGRDTLWIETYRPEPGKLIHHPPDDFKGSDDFEDKTSLRLGPGGAYLVKSDSLPTSNDDTVRFGLNLHILEQGDKDLSTIQYIFIQCDALMEAKIPGFGSGCRP